MDAHVAARATDVGVGGPTPRCKAAWQELENEVRAGRLTPALAAGQLATLMGVRSPATEGSQLLQVEFAMRTLP